MKTFSNFIAEAEKRIQTNEDWKKHIANVATTAADKFVDVAYAVKNGVDRHNQAFADIPLKGHLKARSKKASVSAQAE